MDESFFRRMGKAMGESRLQDRSTKCCAKDIVAGAGIKEMARKCQAYLRRTPRTLPWMVTLAAGAKMGAISVLEGWRRIMFPSR
jgi:hypothetical protein